MFKKIFFYFLNNKFIRFSISGGIATLVDISLLYIFTEFAGIWYLLSSIFSFIIGSFFHFLISRFWVFKNRDKKLLRQYLSFSIIHFVGLFINTAVIYISVEHFHLYYIFAKVLSVFFGVVWTFWANKKFTFSNKINELAVKDNQNIKCPLCGCREVFLLYANTLEENEDFYKITQNQIGKHSDVYQCFSCSLAFIADDQLKNSLVKSYNSDFLDQTYEAEFRGREKAAQKILKNINRNCSSPKLLDIGCYTGIFLSAAKNYGYQVYGLEPSFRAAEVAKKRGLENIEQRFLDGTEDQYPHHYFDVITALDVIEHLKEPQKLVDFANNKLKSGGQLVISTPDFSSLLSKLQKNKWHAVLPHHFYYFSFNNLKKLLDEFGFEVFYRSRQIRYFSTSYLLERVQGIDRRAYQILKSISQILRIENKIWPVNFFDQLLIFARKK